MKLLFLLVQLEEPLDDFCISVWPEEYRSPRTFYLRNEPSKYNFLPQKQFNKTYLEKPEMILIAAHNTCA